MPKRYLDTIKAVLLSWFVPVAVTVAVTSAAFGWEAPALNARIDQTNVLVNNNCSGTLIAKDLVLTVNHCVRDQFDVISREEVDQKTHEVREVKVKVGRPGTVSKLAFANTETSQEIKTTFDVLSADVGHDLALLKLRVADETITPAPVACVRPERGETVYAVGNPFAVLYGTVTKGIISSFNRNTRMVGLTDMDGQYPLMQISAPIEGGNSGGAVYNDRGELVGVNDAASAINETVAFAIPLDTIRAFLQRASAPLTSCAAPK